MASTIPSSTQARAPSDRKQKIARGIALGILAIAGIGLGLGIASGNFDGLSAPVAYLLPAALFCLATFVGFIDEPLVVPARLQLLTYAAAVITGLAFAWVTALIDSKTGRLVLFVLIAYGFRTIAAKLIENQRTQHK